MTLLSPARPRQWLHNHPLALDTLLAAVVFLVVMLASVTEPHGPDGKPRFGERDLDQVTLLIAVLACGAVVLRRRMPKHVLAFTSVAVLAQLFAGEVGTAPADGRVPVVLTVAAALYTVASRTDRPTAWRVGALTVVVMTGSGMLLGAQPWYAEENLVIFAWTGMAAAAGDAVRSRRAFVNAIRERAERAERSREEEARRRVAEERMRIARELHDVVAHHIALINVQAGVASHVMDTRPDQAKEALAHVREASRHALGELQATVGLLRQSGDPEVPTEPTPGLALLDELVGGFRRAGLTVGVEASASVPVSPGGTRFVTDAARVPEVTGALSSAVDLTAYRVVQEALTNVRKHAGTSARAQVRIMRDPGVLKVIVSDDGGRRGGQGDGAGYEADQADRADHGYGAPPDPDGMARDRTTTDGTRVHGATADRTGAARTGAGDQAMPADRTRGGGGHGLVGMRERATALGGTCTAGPHAGGFRVRVTLPVTTRRTKSTVVRTEVTGAGEETIAP